MIASDGNSNPGEPDHPRTTATYARVLAQYVREDRALSLPLAIRKMTLMPAQRLEHRALAMKNKGRIKVGADADIVVFDAAKVKDLATYESPARDFVGMQAVLVKGTRVVRDGKVLDEVLPGSGVRGPIQNQPIAWADGCHSFPLGTCKRGPLGSPYDMSPDGERFLMVKEGGRI
jgi:N-acyl-D-aspartate/D-glutamate deacylase